LIEALDFLAPEKENNVRKSGVETGYVLDVETITHVAMYTHASISLQFSGSRFSVI
jgi:hypothetical protein